MLELCWRLGGQGHRAAKRQLERMGEDAVPWLLMTLSYSREHFNCWNGRLARRRAAEILGRIKVPVAAQRLAEVLHDPDRLLVGKAVWALGEIGDRRYGSAIVPLLGSLSPVGFMSLGWSFPIGGHDVPANYLTLSEIASDAVRKLGGGGVVQAFFRALERGSDSTKHLSMYSSIRYEIVQALIAASDTQHLQSYVHFDCRSWSSEWVDRNWHLCVDPFAAAANAVRALGELDAVEAVPALRHMVRARRRIPKVVYLASRDTMRKLSVLSSLPRCAKVESLTKSFPLLPRAGGWGLGAGRMEEWKNE